MKRLGLNVYGGHHLGLLDALGGGPAAALAHRRDGSTMSGGDDLRDYQHQVLEFAEGAADRFVYADAAGSGKTPTSCVWLDDSNHRSLPSLVVAPESVCDQWLAQIEEWTGLRPVSLRGTPAARKDAFTALDPYDIAVTNYELLRKDQDALAGQSWASCVFDEAHRLKGRSNQVARAARRLKPSRIACLTGTPLLNTADELWMQLHLCRPKEYRSFWAWARLHFYVEMTTHYGKVGRPVPDIVGIREGHAELIRAEAEHCMIWRSIDELLPGLPVVETTIVPVQLGEAERKLYDDVFKKGWGRHNEHRVTTVNAVSKMTRLRQLASDWNGVMHGGDGPYIATPERPGAKVSKAVELLTGRTDQTVVLTAYKQSARLVLDQIPGAVAYTGDETKKERQRAVDAFKAGDAPAIIGTIAALGEGVDGLQVAHRMLRLDRDWTPARNDQVIGRVRRSGQLAARLLVDDIVAEDTVDQRVAEALSDKTLELSAVLG